MVLLKVTQEVLNLSLSYKNVKAQLKIEAKQSFYLFSSLMRTG